ncbi:MAG: superoxide dismutase [Bacteroides sp.]
MNTLLTTLFIMTMTYGMPQLPYANHALEPVISQQTIDFHYGKHLQTYVNNLNSLVPGTEWEGKTLEAIVASAPDGPVFNNAGQVLNHTLYFLQFTPKPSAPQPTGALASAIERDFGSFDNFKKEMNATATGLFGSGWAWLSVNKDGKLQLTKEPNGSNPLRAGLKPLLGFDVWEHSYYLDYQNRRADHINALWNIIDWDVVAQRMK